MVLVMDVINTEVSLTDRANNPITLECQIGIHTGSAIAGIIGHKRFQYDLCGGEGDAARRRV